MNNIVGRIPDGLRVDPDAGGQGRQHKRERPAHKADGRDSVSISDEARRRSVLEECDEPE